ncbi:MAG TPA: patatin-like phospholipase family protein, partial [Paraburkholderia sp.]|nr:patatin-like phospholipase family protein [Paraburkholderia sp.]
YVAATNVNRTALRIFGPGDLGIKPLLASTCYPTLFRAVEIDGEFYWDGGYMANPALRPLVDSENSADDILSILIDPLSVKHGPPAMPRQIVNRINEVSFGASWVTEVRQIELINKLIREGVISQSTPAGKQYREKRLHVIEAENYMEEIGAASKNTPSNGFFQALKKKGWDAANTWMKEHFADVGVKSTFDIETKVNNRLRGTDAAVKSVV